MIKNRITKLEQVDWRNIHDLQPKNLKNVFNYAEIEASVHKYGFAFPFAVWQDKDGLIYAIDGHTRKEVLSSMDGVPELLPAFFIDANNKKEAIRILLDVYNQKHNPMDGDVLADFLLVEEIGVESIAVSSLNIMQAGAEQQSKEGDDETQTTAQEDDFDTTPPVVPKTVLGDLYEIGEHRLLCGDCTDSDAVGRLMNGAIAYGMITDPPYGVKYTGKTSASLTIINDAMDADGTHELWADCFSVAMIYVKPGGFVYATVPPGLLQVGFMEVMLRANALRQCMVWDKGQLVLGHSDYQYAHEPILYGWMPGKPHYFTSDRTRTTVFRHQKPARNADHPTMKPISLWGEFIENSSKTGQVIYDPFSGSGTTIATSHQLGRIGYAMELDPRYCDVAVKRMLALDSSLTVKRNGIDVTSEFTEA